MSIQTPVVPLIAHIRFSGMHFEYHANIGKVYRVHPPEPGSAQARGECIAEHCDTEGRAIGFAQTYWRGYRAAIQESEHGE